MHVLSNDIHTHFVAMLSAGQLQHFSGYHLGINLCCYTTTTKELGGKKSFCWLYEYKLCLVCKGKVIKYIKENVPSSGSFRELWLLP